MTPEWDQVRQAWLEDDGANSPFSEELIRFVDRRTRKFDREMRWRNKAHWGMILAIFIMAATLGLNAEAFSELAAVAFLAVGAIAQAVILWQDGRVGSDPDPASPAASYRKALAEKFDRQIRFLRRSHWAGWALFAGLAFWVGGGIWQAYSTGDGQALIRRSAVFFAIVVLYGINQFISFRKHTQMAASKRDELLEALDRGDPPEIPPRTNPLGLSD
jgi:hypothetical protein